MNRVLNFIIVGLASCFYLSYVPATLVRQFQLKIKGQKLSDKKWTGAGFIGSVFGAIYYLVLPVDIAMSPWAILVGILFAVLISHYAEKILESHDDSRIVIDEWIGVWIALWGFPQSMGETFIIAFILFRVFDVWKGPWGHWLQKLPGGWGVVMDDVAAGVLANVFTQLIVYSIINL